MIYLQEDNEKEKYKKDESKMRKLIKSSLVERRDPITDIKQYAITCEEATFDYIINKLIPLLISLKHLGLLCYAYETIENTATCLKHIRSNVRGAIDVRDENAYMAKVNHIESIKDVANSKIILGMLKQLRRQRDLAVKFHLCDIDLPEADKQASIEIDYMQKSIKALRAANRNEKKRKKMSESHKQTITILDNKSHKRHKFNSIQECCESIGISDTRFRSWMQGKATPKKLKHYTIIK